MAISRIAHLRGLELRVAGTLAPVLFAACAPVYLAELSTDAGPADASDASWALATYIKPRHEESGGDFGATVAWTDDELLIGAPGSALCAIASSGPSDQRCRNQGALTRLPHQPTGNADYRLLKDPDAAEGDAFAARFATSESWLLVGMPHRRREGLHRAGAVRAFSREGDHWRAGPVLTSTAPLPAGADLGGSIAIAEPWAAVLAPGLACIEEGCEGPGAVHIFRLEAGTWRPHQLLWLESRAPVPDAAPLQLWGELAIRSDLLAVGAPHDEGPVLGEDAPGPSVGSVRLYALREGRWQPDERLQPEVSSDHTFFGSAVRLAEGRVYVGAPGEGAVYVFERTAEGTRLEARITVAEGRDGFFGAALSAHGDELLVGAPRDPNCRQGVDPEGWDDGCALDVNPRYIDARLRRGPGAAFLFTRQPTGAWTRQLYLKPETDRPGTEYGAAVVLRPDVVVVGAPNEPRSGHGIDSRGLSTRGNVGAVFVYRRQ